MVNYLIDKILKKRKKHKLAIKISLISILVFIVLLLISYFVNVFILSYSANNVFEQMRENQGATITYDLKKDFLRSKIYLKNLKISIDSGDVLVDKIEMKKKSGIFIPSKININFNEIISTNKYGIEYKIIKKDNPKGMTIKLNKHIFKLPDFGGLEFNSKTKFVINEKNKDIGETEIDRFKYLTKNNTSSIDYKTTIVIHSGNLIKNSSMFDMPINFEAKVLSNAIIGKDNKKTVQMKFNEFKIELDDIKILMKGETEFAESIKNINANILIKNDKKFIDRLFNYILQTKNDNLLTYKKMYEHTKKSLVPRLKKLNENSTNEQLFLKVEKTEIMPEIVINGVGISEIVEDVAKNIK